MILRYFLDQAATLSPSIRRQQVTKALGLENLPRAAFFLIGQNIVSRRLQENILQHRLTPSKRGTPLTFALCGPSGHGKSITAEQLSYFLGVDKAFISLASVDHARDVWGARASSGWSGSGIVSSSFSSRGRG